MNWADQIGKWRERYHCQMMTPLDESVIRQVFEDLNCYPPELVDFYKVSNGLSLDWFKILPIEDPARIKKTWDGLKRANDPATSKYVGFKEGLFAQFLIFSSIGGMDCAVYDRNDFSIWFKQNDDLIQTDLELAEFIETSCREVVEL